MNLTLNLTLKDNTTNDIIRIISLNFRDDRAYLFNCEETIKECQMPYSISIEELNSMIGENHLSIVDDPYLRNIDEEKLSKREISIRDKAFQSLEDLIDSDDIFIPVLRNKLVKAARKRFGVSKPTIYKYLKRYWRNGLNANALLPEFYKCGAPNKERKTGTNDAIRSIARKGFKEFVVDNNCSIEVARIKTNDKYVKELDGKKIEYYLFYLYGRKAFPEADLLRHRIGDKSYDANERLLHGRSNDIVNGPCKLYQIDSTQRDIRIVSALNPNQYIGRPTFYVVLDSWTRAIVGILITLDHPSYIAAAQALFISLRSKETLIRELGLGPEHLGWSNSFIPKELVADRAEFLGPKSNQIVTNLGFKMGNTSAYRPDLKGNVERIIDLVQERVRHHFEGRGQISKNENQRMSKDTRLEACVTLEDLYQITWVVANEHNNFHWIDDYPLTNEMIRDGVRKIPADIHQWGIEQNLGVERLADERNLWYNLMEETEVTPSRKGVRLNKQDYIPIDKESFKIMENLICAPVVKKIKIKYDPRMYKNIFWVHEGAFIKLRLRGQDDAQFANEWEAKCTYETYNEMKKVAKDIEEDQRNINDRGIESIIKRSQKKSRAGSPVVVKDSREAKSLEREINRAINDNALPVQNEIKSDINPIWKIDNKLITKLERVNL